MTTELDSEIAAFLAALANPSRLAILRLLKDSEQGVGALAISMGLSQSAVSQHLSVLRHQELVTRRKDAQNSFYSRRDDVARRRLLDLAELFSRI